MSFVWYCKDYDDPVEFDQENLSSEPVVSEHDAIVVLPEEEAVSIITYDIQEKFGRYK